MASKTQKHEILQAFLDNIAVVGPRSWYCDLAKYAVHVFDANTCKQFEVKLIPHLFEIFYLG